MRLLRPIISQNTFIALGLILIVLLLWLPSGFNKGDIYEHWQIRNLVETGVVNYDNIRPNFLVELSITRPIARVLYWAAYYISPSTFYGDNLIAIGILWGKAFALYLLITQLFSARKLFAFLLAIVFILYPSDSAVVSLRVPHIHMSILCALIGMNFFVAYWRTPQIMYVVACLVGIALSALSYEPIYPVLFFIPAILIPFGTAFSMQLAKIRASSISISIHISLRFIKMIFAWWLVLIATVWYSFILIFVLEYGFQRRVIIEGTEFSLGHYLQSFVTTYDYLFTNAWTNALKSFFSEMDTTSLIALSLITLIVVVWSLILKDKANNLIKPFELRPFISMIVIGILVIGLGYILLGLTDRAAETFRTLLISSFGAALVYSVVAYQSVLVLFRRFGIYIFIAGMSSAIFIAGAYHMVVRETYNEQFNLQGAFFKQIFDLVPGVNQDGVIFVFMLEGEDTPEHIPPRSHLLTSAFHNIYAEADSIEFAFYCDREAACKFEESGIVTRFNQSDRVFGTERPFYSYDNIIIFTLDEQNVVTLLGSIDGYYDGTPNTPYAPERLIDQLSSPPPRLYTFFKRL